MDFNLRVDPETGWGEVSISGDISLADLRDLFLSMWDDSGYARAERALWSIVHARSSMRYDDLVQLTQWVAANKQGRGPKFVAIVATDDATFGMSRMYDALTKEFGWMVRVFRSPEAAREWLRTVTQT